MKVSLGLACVLALGACGSTRTRGGGEAGSSGAGTGGSTTDDAGADSGGAGTTGLLGGSGGAGGAGGSGSGDREENAPCTPDAGQCLDGLSCTTLPSPYEGVCGRACTTDDDCTEADEVCASYLTAGELICINLVPPWNVYQFDQTSFCDETSIPTPIADAPPELRGGLCLQFCLLDGADTSSLTQAEIDSLVACEGGQQCMDLLSSASGDAVVGACATPVDRGASCTAADAICSNLDDICFPLDPMSAASELLCFQDCTDTTVTCETGTCDLIPNAAGGALCDYEASGGGGT